MSTKRILVLLGLGLVVLTACAGAAGEAGPAGAPGPQGEQGPPGQVTCSECHNDTTVLFQAQQQWADSMHGTGTSYGRGTRAGCAGCHSSEGFVAMAAAGMTADEVEEAPLVSSKTNCRTCHEIHTTYTAADYALTASDPVLLYASGETYDGGKGNLCANCHQPRREIAEAEDGMIEIDSSHWGPHHGPQSTMLMGVGGAGAEGSASAHSSMVEDGCVSCHVNEDNGYNHTWEPALASCTGCHADAEDFDINGLQTEVEGLAEEVGEMLKTLGLLDAGGHPVVGNYLAAESAAAWDYILIVLEDGSSGVHNPKYTVALLEAAVEALEPAVEEVVFGEVTAIDEDALTITIETEDGESLTVLVPEDFDFTAIEVGSNVKVRGEELEDGSIDADWVKIVEADGGDH